MNETTTATRAYFYEYMKTIGVWNWYRVFGAFTGSACFIFNGTLMFLALKNREALSLPFLSYIFSDFLASVRPLGTNSLLYGIEIDWLCELFKTMGVVSMLGSVFNGTLLAADRLIAGCYPHSYKQIMSKKRAHAIVITLWLTIIMGAIITRVVRRGSYGCGHQSKEKPMISLIQVIIGASLMFLALVSYAILIMILSSKPNTSETHKRVVSSVRTCFLVTFFNTTGWMPQVIYIANAYCQFGKTCGFADENVNVALIFLCMPMHSLTSAANACFTLYRVPDLRADFIALFEKCKPKSRVAPEGRRVIMVGEATPGDRRENIELQEMDHARDDRVFSVDSHHENSDV